MSTFRKVKDNLDNPKVMQAIHGWATLAWMLLIIPTLLWWGNLVLWVSLMSVWANFVGHWSAWGAFRTEVRQKESDEK